MGNLVVALYLFKVSSKNTRTSSLGDVLLACSISSYWIDGFMFWESQDLQKYQSFEIISRYFFKVKT